MKLEEKIFLLSEQNLERILNQDLELKDFKSREIWKLAKSKDNIVIIGIRRIGKTEFLKQIVKNRFQNKIEVPIKNEKKYSNESFKDEKIDELEIAIEKLKKLSKMLSKKDDNSKILYVKLDAIELFHLVKKDKQEIKTAIREIIKKKKINLLLIDEIQVLDDWNIFIKDLVDEFKNQIQIYATGSNSNLLSKSNEHGLGRFDARYFGVLSFEESKKVKNNNNLETYIDFNHFPEYDLTKYKDVMWQYVIEKAFSDSSSRKDTLFKVFCQIIKNVGKETNLANISKESGLNKTHINEYIRNLITSQLVFKVQNIGKSNKNIKLYPLIPGLYNLLEGKNFSSLSKDKQGHIFEQFILIQILSKKTKLSERIRIGFYRRKIDNKPHEIDFIINDKLIEVKYSRNVDLNKYIRTASILKKNELYFIYCGETKTQSKNGIKIQFINWKEINKYEF